MIKVASEAAQVLIAKAVEAGQGHVLDWWDELGAPEQSALLETIKEIDFQLLQRLINLEIKGVATTKVHLSRPEPVKPIPLPRSPEETALWLDMRRVGEQAIAAGEVAAFMAAGTTGDALGIAGPEGFCPVGPISQKTLFALQAEKLVALNRRHHGAVPLLVMVSEETAEQTKAFFKEQRFFTLPQGSVTFIKQPRLPLIDRRGRMVMSSRSEIALAPNGHGGAFQLMQDPAVLEPLIERGVTCIFYFQVDNPLLPVLDPAFIGFHRQWEAEASAKIVRKESPEEQVGVFVSRGNRVSIIEYSELPLKVREQRDPGTGELTFSCGNMAAHLFSVEFLSRARGEEHALPYHSVEQRVACLDRNGTRVQPSAPNAVRFECYIFDAFPWAEKMLLLEADRRQEFYPVRAKQGRNSPEDVRRALSEKYASWLESAGAAVPRGENGAVQGTYEVSPLFAADREEFKERWDGSTVLAGDSLYLEQ